MKGQSRTDMDPEETMEVPYEETTPDETTEVESEETTPNGEETPEETPAESTPASEPELFDLPDGRKVDAATLSQLWREDFYPEFTRRSQELARITQQQTPNPEETKTDPLKDPNYIPPTYDELAAQIEARILSGMSERAAREAAARQAIEDQAVAQLAEVKKTDPNVNEGQLFQHAMKYGFTDLRVAHANMKDMFGAIKKAQTVTKENIQARVDPVSTKPGATGTNLDPDSFASSVDYLRALKAQGK